MPDSAEQLAHLYHQELFERTIPFWQTHSPDREYGGYFTCLDRTGTVFDTDKFVWLQCRQVWLFSMLYNQYEPRSEWLELARLGADFLLRHGRAPNGQWYFALTRQGQPLIQPYNIFSDFFAAMALGQYGRACGDESVLQVARATYHQILTRRDNPKGIYNKMVPGTRPLRSMGFPMIMANLALEIEPLLDQDELEHLLDTCIDDVFGLHLDRDRMLLFEHVAPDGSRVDCFDGRLINPGHGIEAAWFIMDIAERRGDRALVEQACEVVLSTLAYAWDDSYGGLYYFMDAEGHPPQQLEWNQKLWWVHLETLVALLKGYRLTRREELWRWFERVHRYSWNHFTDPEYGEWFGYLDRRGDILLPLKGGKWKGCFHVPRGLWQCRGELRRIAQPDW